MKRIVIGGKKLPPRIVFYGPPKVGKSTFASESPAPVFVGTEDGVDNIPVPQYPRATSWPELLENVREIANEKHEYKSIVIDTLNGAAELASQHVCQKVFAGDWGPKGFASFGQGWAATSEEMRQLQSILDACRARGMYVILLAHTGLTTVRNPIQGEYSKFAPDVDRRVWARFQGWADMILRADFDYTVITRREGTKGQAIGTSQRVIFAVGSAAEDAGCRVGYELPEKLPLSWEAFQLALGGTASLADEARTLWPALTSEEQSKALGFLGIASINDIGKAQAQKLAQIVNRLREKAAAAQKGAADDSAKAA